MYVTLLNPVFIIVAVAVIAPVLLLTVYFVILFLKATQRPFDKSVRIAVAPVNEIVCANAPLVLLNTLSKFCVARRVNK
jgi:hypothetical protein